MNRPTAAPRGRGQSSERGSATAELVLLTPLLIVFLLFVVALGRLAGARLHVDSAARQAARAASIARDPATAIQAAQATAAASLAGSHVTCAHSTVATDTAGYRPGGWVAVRLTCAVDLADLSGLRLPAAETVTARFVEPIDRFRGAG